MDLEKLGETIRAKRKEIGIPPSTVADRSGIQRHTLWVYERAENPSTGKPSRPSKDKLERLAEVLRMSREESDELLSLADYHTPSQPPSVSSSISDAKEQAPAAPTITKIDGVIYAMHDGYLEAFDASTGERRWPKPVRLQSRTSEETTHLPQEKIEPRPPQRQEPKRQRLPDTEPLSPGKRAARLRPAKQSVSEPGSGVLDAFGKKKRGL